MRHIVLFLIVFLLLGGCSANDDWVHTFTGESDNWIVVMEIRPNESEHTTVSYPFYLTKKMENQVTKLYAEADLVNGGRASNLNQIDLEEINQKRQLLLFQKYPNPLTRFSWQRYAERAARILLLRFENESKMDRRTGRASRTNHAEMKNSSLMKQGRMKNARTLLFFLVVSTFLLGISFGQE